MVSFASTATVRRRPGGVAARLGLIAGLTAALVAPISVLGAEAPRARLELVSLPIWHEPGRHLDLRVRVVNHGTEPLRGFRLVIGVDDRLATRSALHESYDDGESFLPSTFPREYEVELESGESATVAVRDRVSKLALLADATEGGVYPMSVALQGPRTDHYLDRLNVPLLYYPHRPQARLNLVPLVPLNDVPARRPGGALEIGGSSSDLENAVRGAGWLRGLVDALRAATRRGLHVGVAPTPRLVEELGDMTDGYDVALGERRRHRSAASGPARAAAALLDEARALFEERGVERVLVPYAFPDLPALTEHLDSAPDAGHVGSTSVQRQVAVGRIVLEDVLGVGFDGPWFFAPAGRLDTPTLDALRLATLASRTFFSPDSLHETGARLPVGCPEKFASFTCPVRVQTETASSVGYVSDPELQERLGRLVTSPDPALDLQRVFAETAMIHAELPAREDRVVQATIPAFWRPPARLAARLFGGLARVPWLATTTPSEGLAVTSKRVARRVVDRAPAVVTEPDSSYYATLSRAEVRVDDYASIQPPIERLRRLRRDLLVAESRAWWLDDARRATGANYAVDAGLEVERELAKIRLGSRSEMTLSSERTPIPLVLFNDTGYPVTVDVAFESPKMTVDESQLRDLRIDRSTTQLEIDAAIRASGTFPVTATVRTGSGRRIDEAQIIIRSTRFNRIALGLTIGAFVFLVLFYVLRAVRHGADSRKSPAGAKDD